MGPNSWFGSGSNRVMGRSSVQTAAIAVLTATFVSLGSAAAPAQDRVEVKAAIEAARAELRGQILAMPVAPGVSVAELVQNDPGAVKIDDLVSTAERVGQPRWVEKDIVQVKMSLPASKVLEQVNAIPVKSRDPRVTQKDVDRFNREWSRRSFSSTGQAIPASRLNEVVTSITSVSWRDVSESARIEAANRARATATSSIVEKTGAIRVTSDQAVGAAYLLEDGRKKLTSWADGLPATRVMLRDDRQVEVAVYVDKDELGKQVRQAATTELTSQPDKLAALDVGISRMPSIVVGRASVASSAEAPTLMRGPAVVFRGMPAWASGDAITAEASATSVNGSRLRTARAAEQKASEALQKKVLELKLDGTTTINQAGDKDARIADAVTRAIGRARTYQVDYNPDGSATVRLSLDPNDLIDELTTSR